MNWILIVVFMGAGAVQIEFPDPASCRKAAEMWDSKSSIKAFCYEKISSVILYEAKP